MGLTAANKGGRGYPIDFREPPPVGTVIEYRGELAELVAVEPITRRSDGAPSFLLRWRIGTRRARSGLRAESVMWDDRGGPDAGR